MDNVIRGNGSNGLRVRDGVHATITRATISGNGSTGVLAQGSGGTTTIDITGSTMDANVQCVVASSTAAAVLVKVSVRNNVADDSDAISGIAPM